MPVYFMSTFMLPQWVIKAIDKIRRRFLWHGHKEHTSNRYLGLIAWDNVTKPKCMGGMGIKDLEVMNKALLAKYGWNWLNKPEIWNLRDLYSLQEHASPWLQTYATPFWQNLKHTEPFIIISTRFEVKEGQHIRFWLDKWQGKAIAQEYQVLFSFNQQQAGQQGQWQLHLRETLTEEAQQQKEHILSHLPTPQFDSQQRDGVIWKWTTTGKFTVKSSYRALKEGPRIASTLMVVWTLKLPTRVAIFAWLL